MTYIYKGQQYPNFDAFRNEVKREINQVRHEADTVSSFIRALEKITKERMR